jgi:hypothetical protein
MKHSTKVKKAWGKDYPKVNTDMDKDGWYNGAKDKVQLTFAVEVIWIGAKARPVSLTDDFTRLPKALIKEEPKEEETAAPEEPAK